MYVAYFLIYMGIGLATASWLYLLMALIRQISEYWIILSEERWSIESFGQPYEDYCQKVRRYLGRK
jgi:protein-S-isoprenylcysteine O-methyltransferase Ste14